MNAPTKLPTEVWPTEALTPEAKAQAIKQGPSRSEEIASLRGVFRTTGWAAAGVLGVLALMGMGAGAVAIWKQQPNEPYVIWGDMRTGALYSPMRAIEATQRFTEGTAEQHLRMYLEYCESYQWAIATTFQYRCQLYLAPEQQRLFVEAQAFTNAQSDQRVYGQTGSSSIANGVRYRRITTGEDGAQRWQITYTKVRALPGKPPECIPTVTDVTFHWRPGLKMKADDRPWNLGGMQITNRTTDTDPTREQGCTPR